VVTNSDRRRSSAAAISNRQPLGLGSTSSTKHIPPHGFLPPYAIGRLFALEWVTPPIGGGRGVMSKRQDVTGGTLLDLLVAAARPCRKPPNPLAAKRPNRAAGNRRSVWTERCLASNAPVKQLFLKYKLTIGN
jgi:hypothetical protein